MKSLNSELMNDQDRLKAISKEADKSRDMDKERNKNKERAGTYNIVARNCFANEEQCRKPSEKKISSFFDNCTPSSKIKEANK